MRLVLLGPPGVGKGTQAQVLAKLHGVPHISSGDMFRAALRQGTPLGLVAKRYMEQGALVPDDVTIGLVRERLSNPDCARGFILDGFPRTTEQAQALEGVLSDLDARLDRVINIEADTETLVLRLTGRRTCSRCQAIYHVVFNPPPDPAKCPKCGGTLYQREDDREDTVRRRLAVYLEKTEPLIGYYRSRGLLSSVNGDRDIDDVTREIQECLKEVAHGGNPEVTA